MAFEPDEPCPKTERGAGSSRVLWQVDVIREATRSLVGFDFEVRIAGKPGGVSLRDAVMRSAHGHLATRTRDEGGKIELLDPEAKFVARELLTGKPVEAARGVNHFMKISSGEKKALTISASSHLDASLTPQKIASSSL